MAETHFDPGNIITGSAMLFQGAVGAVLPVMPPLAGAMPTPDVDVWTPIGYTDAGIKVAYDPTYKDVTVDEEMSPVDALMTAEKLVVSCSIAELTPENIARLISTANAPTTVAAAVGTAGTKTLQHGGQQNTKKYSYLLVGNGPQGFPRMVQIYRAVATTKLDMTYKRGEKVMTPVEITSLALATNAVGNRLWQIVDKIANGTA